MQYRVTIGPRTGTPRDKAPARRTNRVAKSTTAGEGMSNADRERLHFILERISAAYDELDETERTLNGAAETKPQPTPEPEPEPEPEPKPQKGMKAAVKLGRGQVDTAAAIRDRVKK